MRTRVITSIAAAASATALLVAVPAAGASSLRSFLSPSGNIACIMSSSGARCDIHVHTYTAPPVPKSCHLAYGDSVGVGTSGRGGLNCHGDTVFGNYPRLAYGHSITLGSFTCSSASTGITCKDVKDGHGFFISRESYRLF